MMNEAVQTVTPLACLSRSVIGMVNASSDRLAMVACMPGFVFPAVPVVRISRIIATS